MLIITISLIAAVITAPEVIVLFTPLAVMLATELVKKMVPLVAGWVIVLLIVPLLSVTVTMLSNLIIDPGLNFWAQVGFGLLAVFVNQAYKQLKELWQNQLQK
jgi:hypothetical protein